MTQQAEITSGVDNADSADELGDEFDFVGDQHRAAAQHFATAAPHHPAAADDEADGDAAGRHSCLAIRHRLNGVQYAASAVMDNRGYGAVMASGR